MQKLKEVVNKICGVIEPGKEVNTDITKQLEQVEYKLFLLLETREHIEIKEQGTFKEVEQWEKKLDSQRRQDKVEKMKKLEKEEILQQQLKNDERARKNMEKKVQQGLKVTMTRSEKPEPQRKVKEVAQLTEEQMDYIRYVVGGKI